MDKMDDKEIFWNLEKIVRESLELTPDKEITPETDLREDLGMDSLDQYELIFGIESRFDLNIPEDDPKMHRVKTIRELADYLKANYKI